MEFRGVRGGAQAGGSGGNEGGRIVPGDRQLKGPHQGPAPDSSPLTSDTPAAREGRRVPLSRRGRAARPARTRSRALAPAGAGSPSPAVIRKPFAAASGGAGARRPAETTAGRPASRSPPAAIALGVYHTSRSVIHSRRGGARPRAPGKGGAQAVFPARRMPVENRSARRCSRPPTQLPSRPRREGNNRE